MTIHAYQETYLSKAQASLGDAFDYAINTCEIPGEDFIKYFTAGSVSKRMENGEPAFLAGKSGIEIAVDVVLDGLKLFLVLDGLPVERDVFASLASVARYESLSVRELGDRDAAVVRAARALCILCLHGERIEVVLT